MKMDVVAVRIFILKKTPKSKRNEEKNPEEIRVFLASEDYSCCATLENPSAL